MYIEDHPYCFNLGGSSRNIQKMIDERIPFHVSLEEVPERIPFFIFDSFPIPENIRGIVVQSLPCHFGGYRYDFVCPICMANYRKMYLTPHMEFICRNCHRLSYRSKSLNKPDRLTYRKKKIHRQYGINPSKDFISKKDRPSGMHRKTFGKFLHKKAAINERICWEEYVEELKMLQLYNQAYPQHAVSLSSFRWR